MKLRRIGAAALGISLLGAAAQAGLPKPVALVDRVATSQSRGGVGFHETKYNKASWGNRWKQSLAAGPLIVAPSVRAR